MTREELQRLIDVIVQELAVASTRSQATCACHAVAADCCPDRLRVVIDAGAARVGMHAAGGAPAEIAALIDHTLLKPVATRQIIE
jgi:deoxyribose-phosphate aldolase